MKSLFPVLLNLRLSVLSSPVYREEPPVDSAKPPVDPKTEKKYSQKDLDDASARTRGHFEKEAVKKAQEYERLSQDSRLTIEERDTWKQRHEETERLYKTEQQLKDEAVGKKDKEWKTKYDELDGKLKETTSRHENLLIDIELTREAAQADELIPGQLVKFVKGDTKLVEEMDEATGKPKPEKVVRIALEDVVEGKPVKLLLSAKDAFKRMKEAPAKYGNFFKGSGTGGIGGFNGGGGGIPQGAPKDTEAYIAKRNAGRK